MRSREHSTEPGGARVSSPGVLLSGPAPHPQRQSDVKGPKKGSAVIKGTWERDSQIGEGRAGEEREREAETRVARRGEQPGP